MEEWGSLLEALDFWAKQTPSKTALTFLDDAGAQVDALTYSEILHRSNSLAAHLLSDSSNLGLTKGSTCLLVYPPSLEFTVAYLACLRAGVIAVPCFPPDPKRLKKDLNMFSAIQGSSGATVALTSRTYNYAKKMADIKSMFSGGTEWPELQWVVTDYLPANGGASELDGGFPVPDPADVAFLQYTSGSTSEPKGVMITHSNLANNLKLIVKGLSAIDDTVVVSWLPQYHDMGLIGSVLALLFCGGSGFYMSPASFIKRPSLWVELISRHRGTHMQAPNFAYGLTARKFLALEQHPQLDLSCVRHMINAAEPVDAASIDRFYAVFEAHGLKRGVIFPTYGLAEHTVYVCSNGRSRLVVDKIMLETDRKIRPVADKLELWTYGTDAAGALGGPDEGVLTTALVGCGRPADSSGVDLRVVDTETALPLDEGNVGEIWIGGQSRAAGYWSQLEKTAEDFGARLADSVETPVGGGGGADSGYLRTGDLGFLWEGELYICGRIKDLVIVRGRNHYPQDIERTAEAAVAGALRGGCSAAFGTAAPDGGEALALVAEVAQPAGLDGEALAAEIRRCVAAEHGASLAYLRLLRPRTVPKTTSGKIARSMCKRAHVAGTLDGDTIFMWGEPITSAAARDATAEKDEAPSSPNGGGVEESKFSGGPSGVGGRGDPREMAEADILLGVQSEVARILKADALSIPTDAPLGALGLDSMEAMQLMALLEDRFSVKLPDEVMLEEDTTLSTLAPIIKTGGVIPERVTAIDCGKLTELEAKEGPPKDYMVAQAVLAREAKRLAASSFKTTLETGKFKPGCLSEKVTMSAADSVFARGFLTLVAGLEFQMPVLFFWLLFFKLLPLFKDGLPEVLANKFRALEVALKLVALLLFTSVVATSGGAALWKHLRLAGRFSRLRASLMKHIGLRVVVDGKQEPGTTYVYVGVGLGAAEQLLLASMAPSALARTVRPTYTLDFMTARKPSNTAATDGLKAALEQGESASAEARSTTAAGLAPAVALAMRHGAQVVPCAVLGSSAGQGEWGRRFAVAAAAAQWGLGRRPEGVVIVCAKPVRVPFTAEPTQALVMEFAESARVAAAKTLADHSDGFFGTAAIF